MFLDNQSADVLPGDLYQNATKEQIEYGITYVVPYSKSRKGNLMWGMIPDRAAIMLSFICCIPCVIQYNKDTDVLLLPGDRSVLQHNGKILAYGDVADRTIWITSNDNYGLGWACTLAKLKRAAAIAHGLKTQVDRRDLWLSILINLLDGYSVEDMEKDQQSRLQWELRVRRGP